MNIIQRILGSHNTQIINLPSENAVIDIVPQDIEEILDFINEGEGEKLGILEMIQPDLDEKNKLNGIDEEQRKLIDEDVPSFQEIEDCLRNNRNGNLRKKYTSAARILNVQYMSKFQKNFPEFVVQVAKKYYDNGNTDCENISRLVSLMHYMYSECDIGIRP